MTREDLANILYDGVGRLRQVQRGTSPVSAYVYDPIGNLLDKGGTLIPHADPTRPHAPYDAADPERFGYDAVGNMTKRNVSCTSTTPATGSFRSTTAAIMASIHPYPAWTWCNSTRRASPDVRGGPV
jgi:hypothetical protein